MIHCRLMKMMVFCLFLYWEVAENMK